MGLNPTSLYSTVPPTYRPPTFVPPHGAGERGALMTRKNRIRQLYYGDNLPVLRTMPDALVDLIYLDPPFNSNRAYNVIYPDDMGQVTAFEDTWAWKTECDHYLADIEAHTSELSHILPALVQGMGKTQLSAYLVNMAVRLLELHRVLKPTGSLYLHCDPTASHYLKVVLDAIFGHGNFRNELVWQYSTFHGSKRAYKKNYDQIFFYTNTQKHHFDWESIAEPYDPEAVSKILAQQDDEAGELHEAEIVGGMIFIADDQPPKVAQPGEEPLHLPPPLVAAQRAPILSGRFFAIAAVRGNHLDPQLAEASVEGVGVIRAVANEASRQRGHQPIFQRGHYEGDLVGRSALGTDGERQTSAVCHCQELRTLAPLGFAHGAPPFLAAMNVPSMKHSLRSRPPRFCTSSARACRTRPNVPSRTQR